MEHKTQQDIQDRQYLEKIAKENLMRYVVVENDQEVATIPFLGDIFNYLDNIYGIETINSFYYGDEFRNVARRNSFDDMDKFYIYIRGHDSDIIKIKVHIVVVTIYRGNKQDPSPNKIKIEYQRNIADKIFDKIHEIYKMHDITKFMYFGNRGGLFTVNFRKSAQYERLDNYVKENNKAEIVFDAIENDDDFLLVGGKFRKLYNISKLAFLSLSR